MKASTARSTQIMERSRTDRGFSMIEIVFVLMVLAALVAIYFSSFGLPGGGPLRNPLDKLTSQWVGPPATVKSAGVGIFVYQVEQPDEENKLVPSVAQAVAFEVDQPRRAVIVRCTDESGTLRPLKREGVASTEAKTDSEGKVILELEGLETGRVKLTATIVATNTSGYRVSMKSETSFNVKK